MKLLSRLFDRDTVWYTAWSLIPVALVVNAWLGYEYESSLRWRERAQIQAQAGNWEEAAQFYSAAAEASPRSSDLAYNAGVSYRNLGDHERARYWNQMALLANPEFAPALEVRQALEGNRAATRAPGLVLDLQGR